MRRIGVLTPFVANDAEGQARLTAFARRVCSTRLDRRAKHPHRIYRWGDGRADTMRKYAAELVALAYPAPRRAIAGGDPHCLNRVRGYRS
jgi:hypothetical protein